MGSKNLWSYREMLVCLAHYATLSEKERRNPPKYLLLELANLIGRSTGSISLRFANFNSVDPLFIEKGLKSMQGGGGHVHEIWSRFSKNDGTLDLNLLLRNVSLELYIQLKDKVEG